MTNPILAATRAAALILEDADAKTLPMPFLASAWDRLPPTVKVQFRDLAEVTEWALAYDLTMTGDEIAQDGKVNLRASGFALDFPIECVVVVQAELVSRRAS